MTSMLDELDAIPEEKHMEICRKADELQKQNFRGRMRELKFRAWSEETKSFDYFDLYEGTECGLTNLQIWARNSPIEQCTGLKDKNGKEIYEGDILQIDDHILGDFEVVWHNLGWAIKRAVGYETLSVHKPNDITVIGNIHESPEMLEEEE